MYIANPIGFGIFIGVVSTIVVEIVACIAFVIVESSKGGNE